jgi:hypothetical protein
MPKCYCLEVLSFSSARAAPAQLQLQLQLPCGDLQRTDIPGSRYVTVPFLPSLAHDAPKGQLNWLARLGTVRCSVPRACEDCPLRNNCKIAASSPAWDMFALRPKIIGSTAILLIQVTASRLRPHKCSSFTPVCKLQFECVSPK